MGILSKSLFGVEFVFNDNFSSVNLRKKDILRKGPIRTYWHFGDQLVTIISWHSHIREFPERKLKAVSLFRRGGGGGSECIPSALLFNTLASVKLGAKLWIIIISEKLTEVNCENLWRRHMTGLSMYCIN